MKKYNARNLTNRLYRNVVLPLATAGTLALTSCIGGTTPISTPTQTPVEVRTSTPTRETTPIPIIEKLSWSSIREVNNRIYDINVIFEVGNALNLDEVRVSLIPVQYEHLSPEAFPQEEPRIDILEPKGLEEEKFSVDFQNLEGGREYDIEVEAKDENGNIVEEDIRTPYIRQLENIAPLDDILVGVFYYPWYNKDDTWFDFWFDVDEWASLGYQARPLMGQYYSDDMIVVNRHIDEMTGHGIDYILISWGYQGGPRGFIDNVVREFILRSPLINQIKFAILYESNGRLTRDEESGTFNLSDPQNRQNLRQDSNYLKNTYFHHPSYLEIEGRKFIFFDASRFFVGDIQGALDGFRESMKPYEAFLVNDILGNYLPPTDPQMIELLRAFDAITADDMWANNYGDPSARSDFISYTEQALRLWESEAEKYGKDMIPSINPGWEPWLSLKQYKDFSAPFLERDPERYATLLSIALNYSHHIIGGHFNEFFTHNHIERDTKHYDQFLRNLRSAIAN